MRTITTSTPCPQCCAVDPEDDCPCSCLGSGWSSTEPDCPDGEEAVAKAVTSNDCDYSCRTTTCYKCEPVCACDCLGSEWSEQQPNCPEGQSLDTQTAGSEECGYDCASKTCYRCIDDGDPCTGCNYDGEPDYYPSCYDYCPWEKFTQTVTISSSTPGCENCTLSIEQEVCGCNTCPCECSWLGSGWAAGGFEKTCPPGYTLEVRNSNTEDNPNTSECGEEGKSCSSTPCYRCVPDDSGGGPGTTECCNEDGTCTWFCPADICDNSLGPGEVGDGAPCCDDNCIDCGDCGNGGAQCCNSLTIGSLFDPLTDEPEEMSLAQFVEDLAAYETPALTTFVLEHKLGITQTSVKFSVLYRAYLLDALAEMAAGAEFYPTMMKHHRAWQVFVNQLRAVRTMA